MLSNEACTMNHNPYVWFMPFVFNLCTKRSRLFPGAHGVLRRWRFTQLNVSLDCWSKHVSGTLAIDISNNFTILLQFYTLQIFITNGMVHLFLLIYNKIQYMCYICSILATYTASFHIARFPGHAAQQSSGAIKSHSRTQQWDLIKNDHTLIQMFFDLNQVTYW